MTGRRCKGQAGGVHPARRCELQPVEATAGVGVRYEIEGRKVRARDMYCAACRCFSPGSRLGDVVAQGGSSQGFLTDAIRRALQIDCMMQILGTNLLDAAVVERHVTRFSTSRNHPFTRLL